MRMGRREVLRLGLPAAMLTRWAGAEGEYEEALFDSSPYRVAQWREMAAYLEGLPDAVLPALPGAGVEETAAMRALLGFPPPGLALAGEPRIEPVGEDREAHYFRVWVPVHARMRAYGLLLVPKQRPLPAPLVISLHGNVGYPELALFRGGANYHDMVRGAMREGYVTFAPLVVTAPANDDRQGTPIPKDVRQRLDFAARPKGTTLWAVEIRKIQLALDALVRHPAVDADRVTMVGLSLGGYYTLRTALLEPRIRAAVVSCPPDVYVQRERSATGAFPETRDLSNAQCAVGIAPRALQLQYGIDDPLARIDAARRTQREFQEIAAARGLQEPRLDYQEFAGKHEFRGDIAWDFLRQHLSRR